MSNLRLAPRTRPRDLPAARPRCPAHLPPGAAAVPGRPPGGGGSDREPGAVAQHPRGRPGRRSLRLLGPCCRSAPAHLAAAGGGPGCASPPLPLRPAELSGRPSAPFARWGGAGQSRYGTRRWQCRVAFPLLSAVLGVGCCLGRGAPRRDPDGSLCHTATSRHWKTGTRARRSRWRPLSPVLRHPPLSTASRECCVKAGHCPPLLPTAIREPPSSVSCCPCSRNGYQAHQKAPRSQPASG